MPTPTVIKRVIVDDYDDDDDDMQSELDEYYNIPTAHEQAQKHKELFYNRNKITEARPQKEFDAGFAKRFPDIDPFYFDGVYSLYKNNVPEFIEAVNDFIDTGKTKNKFMFSEMFAVIKQNRQLIVQFTGLTGGGKSRGGQSWAFDFYAKQGKNCIVHVDPENLADAMIFYNYPDPAARIDIVNKRAEVKDNTVPTVHVWMAYDYDTGLQMLKDVVKKGEALIIDEVQTLHGEGSRIETDALADFIQNCTRKLKISIVVCTPGQIKLPEIRGYLRVIAMNKDESTTACVLSIPTLDFKSVNDKGPVIINAAQPVDFTKWYDDHSEKVKERIKARGGGSGAKINLPDVEKLGPIIVDTLKTVTDGSFKKFLQTPTGTETLGKSIDELVAHPKLVKPSVDFAKYLIENPPPPPVDPARVTPPVPAGPSDAEIANAELNRVINQGAHDVGDLMRCKFLQRGLNVTRDEIIDLQTGKITLDQAKELSKIHNDEKRKEMLEISTKDHAMERAAEMFDAARDPIAEILATPGTMTPEEVAATIVKLKQPATARGNMVIPVDPGDIFTFDVPKALHVYETEAETKIKDKKQKTDMYRFFMRIDLAENDKTMIEELKGEEPQFAATNRMTQQLVTKLMNKKYKIDIAQQNVSKYIEKISDWLYNGPGVGQQWETWIHDWYSTHKHDPSDICTHDGRKGFFDERLNRKNEAVIIAAKCMTADAREKSYTSKDLDPEIKEANRWHAEHPDWNVEMWVDFYCTRNNTRQVRKYDYTAPVSVKFDTGL